MQSRDIYGVPLEPAEPKTIALTWDNEPIYEGEEVYKTPSGDYILAGELQEWLDYTIGQPFILESEDF